MTELVPGNDWSEWSEPYSHPGARITSPTPREYLQIRAGLLSEDPEAYATLRSLQIQFFTPLVQQIVGEIHPTEAQRAGKPEDFSLYLRPSFVSSNMGFDEILFYSPSHVDIRLQSLHVGTAEQYADGSEEVFWPEDLGIHSAASDSVLIHLPYAIVPGEKDLIRIRFSSTIYLNGSAFEASVSHS